MLGLFVSSLIFASLRPGKKQGIKGPTPTPPAASSPRYISDPRLLKFKCHGVTLLGGFSWDENPYNKGCFGNCWDVLIAPAPASRFRFRASASEQPEPIELTEVGLTVCS